jgi:cytochrome c2
MRRAAALACLALAACGCATTGSGREPVPGGDPDRGKQLIVDIGCGACHTIPGIPGADARVGTDLHDWREQRYIAGKYGNNEKTLIAWLMNPQRLNPGTLMPNLRLSRTDARDIAAYLYERT